MEPGELRPRNLGGWRVRTLSGGEGVEAYTFPDPPGAEGREVDPTHVFPVAERPVRWGEAVAPDLGRAVYTTSDGALVCVDRAGTELWRFALGATGPAVCDFSLDAALVWLCRLAETASDLATDQWVVLDAATGAVLASADLGTRGVCATHFAHPAGAEMVLDVGYPEMSGRLFRGRPDGGRIVVDEVPLGAGAGMTGDAMVDLSPDGTRFLTMDQELTVRSYPDGEVVATVTGEDLGDPEADPGGERSVSLTPMPGGYLDAGTAIVAAHVDYDEEPEDEDTDPDEGPPYEWYETHLVDTRTGAVLGRFGEPAADAPALIPLGDGSWVVLDDERGRWVRHGR
ncbi:hypothetical protein KIK06_24640 [Nocardiopsis sp. EMB25]|uniref:hypothetical protein n=1 Tax=Nocardiopsis sp. EMB25 TaxID=2835867 RepID=UPI0022845EB7|nr:hypothetical protein [Nocardiopsis sp. EMB25]MCY9787077.1 hypothetical protein [Nocardiopsis sp. EMB25]